LISSESGGTGNGGNITINAPLVIAVPSENSDIIANAVTGRGGNIQITTQSLFGLKYNSQLTPESDITASSQFGVNGTVQINNIGINPNNGLIQLPVDVTDASQQIVADCGAYQGSRFGATGRGGLPPNPAQEVTSDRPWDDVRDLSAYHKTNSVITQIPPTPEVLISATSWHRNANGKVELIAEQSSPHLPSALTCAQIRSR
jgi:large exoprotein involved in heme utilization and adhesion